MAQKLCVSAGGVLLLNSSNQLINDCGTDPCGPTGACCKNDGTCSVITHAACTAVSGLYKGDGVSCSGLICGCCCGTTLPSTLYFNGTIDVATCGPDDGCTRNITMSKISQTSCGSGGAMWFDGSRFQAACQDLYIRMMCNTSKVHIEIAGNSSMFPLFGSGDYDIASCSPFSIAATSIILGGTCIVNFTVTE